MVCGVQLYVFEARMRGFAVAERDVCDRRLRLGNAIVAVKITP
jgi:hypothetical protein